jgi:peptidoglycan/xylan/chitin deacetylase (PgdA/CDA1 family)
MGRGATQILSQLSQLKGTADELRPASPLRIKRLAGFQLDETWTATDCTAAPDASVVAFGLQSLKVQLNAGQTATLTCTLPVATSIRSCLGVLLRADDLTKISYGVAYVYEDTTKGHYTSTLFSPNWKMRSGEWALPWLMRYVFRTDTWGGELNSPAKWPDYSADSYAVAKVVIQIVPVAGQAPTVWLNGIYTQDYPRGIVSLKFDDGYQNTKTLGLPVLRRHKMRGGVALIGSAIGTVWNGDQMMTAAEIDELAAEGWGIYNHSYTHPEFMGMTAAAQVTEIAKGYAILEQNGWHRGKRVFVTPGGSASNTTNDFPKYLAPFADMAVGRNYQTFQGVSTPGFSYPANSLMLPNDILNLQYAPASGLDLSNIYTLLDQTEQDRGIFPLTIHQVGETANSYTITPTQLEAICTYIETKGLEVLPLDDYYDREWRKHLPPLTLPRSAVQ